LKWFEEAKYLTLLACITVLSASPPTIAKPRIISLAPHTTELIFAVGAGEYLVGVDRYSDFPAAVSQLPVIGDAFNYDLEHIIALKPTLLLAWHNNQRTQKLGEILHAYGVNVFYSEPKTFNDIPKDLRALGKLTQKIEQSETAAQHFETQLTQLQSSTQQPRLRVFYQLSNTPLMTLSNQDLIGQAMQLCGGQNIFGNLSGLAPQINTEAVLHAQPQVIIATISTDKVNAQWQQWANLPAIKNQHIYSVTADFVSRPGPRILQGVRQICDAIENARTH